VLLVDVEKILSDLMREYEDVLVQQVTGAGLANGLNGQAGAVPDDSAGGPHADSQDPRPPWRQGHRYDHRSGSVWDMLISLADDAEGEHKTVGDFIRLVLSDVEMPAKDGFTLTKRIRADARFQDIPIILHSSLTGICNCEHGNVVGATDYVGKFDPKELSTIVLKYCAERRTPHSN
jgi:two-component system, chemotaxis family, chemotaxis protein CheV